jgi:hypothetical protein
MSIPLDAPIFMLPLAGMMFLIGAAAHQFAGTYLADDDGILWACASLGGMALQVGAVVILISA